MNLLLPFLVLVVVGVLSVVALLLARRIAPEGGFFSDSDRAAGVFGVLATGFTFLLSFIVFLAFTSYDNSRIGSDQEALQVLQLFETAQFMAPDASQELSGELICYGRFVVEEEWPEMEDGSVSTLGNPWGIEMFFTLQTVEPDGAVEESAYDKWRDETSAREEARRDRIHGAEGIIPTTLWIVLLLGAAVLFVYMLFFADSGERALVQALQIGTVVVMLGATLLLIRQLNHPFASGVGGLEPTAMERTLDTLETLTSEEIEVGELPCDESGAPLQ